LVQNLSVESLARLGEDGRVEPSLAQGWELAKDGRTLVVRLREGVMFHDGSPLNPTSVAAVLPDALRTTMGPVFADVERVRASGENSVEIRFTRPSPLALESLEVEIKKQGPAIIATGPFMVSPEANVELKANTAYYLGPPQIDRVRIETFPALRTAWAEMLRDRLDMVYEVGPDALDLLESSRTLAVFNFTRRYQYLIALNTASPQLRSSTTRRALNLAVDRGQLVRHALNGHGIASSGPFWPGYWALGADASTFEFDPRTAAEMLATHRATRSRNRSDTLTFTCLVLSDTVYERIALEVKRQLELVGVDMRVQEVAPDQLFEATKSRNYDAVLVEGVSGPTLLRIYQLWHSGGVVNPGSFGNAHIDTALDLVRDAQDELTFRESVAELQRVFSHDPPAIFLAWSVRARAVSRRFMVPAAEPGRDILSTLRLWKPADGRQGSQN
jgi:peptide/nickel transport system substrate-binding protein